MTTTSHSAILQASALGFGYGETILFSNFTANLPPGITLVSGGDGFGKSTLLGLLAGVLLATSGQLQLGGLDLHTQPAHYKARVYFAQPRSDAFDQLTVQAYFELQRSTYPGFSDLVLSDVAAGLGLQSHLHKQLFMLSTGSKRKVFLAAALACGAAVTLLDEPFAALDGVSINFLSNWLGDPRNTDSRAWVIADYQAPQGLKLVQIIELGK